MYICTDKNISLMAYFQDNLGKWHQKGLSLAAR